MNQDVVKLEITMHDVLIVQCRHTSDDLPEALDSNLLRKAFLQVKHVLQSTTVSEIKDAVVVRSGFDDFVLLDYVRAIDHREEDHLTAEGQHALLPVVRITFALFKDPIRTGNLPCKLLVFKTEEPDGGLDSLTQLFLKQVTLSFMFNALDGLQVELVGIG